MSDELAELIRSEIRRDGPITVARFMELALYHPRYGYYGSGRTRADWRGDFITSPQLDPAYGALWTRGFGEMWTGAGRPETFTVIEIGPGEAGMAEAVLAAAAGPFAAALRYVLVERSAEGRARQQRSLAADGRVSWTEALEDVVPVTAGVVFANEILDNQPVHVVERREQAVLETFVSTQGEHLVEVLEEVSPEVSGWVAAHGEALVEGGRAEVRLEDAGFVELAASKIERGAVIATDYGDRREDLLRRAGGTLVCYSLSGADDDYLGAPGSKDITAHVDWTGVEAVLEGLGLEVCGPLPQHEVLRRLGARDLDDELRRAHDTALQDERGADAIALLSRRQALRALLDAGGLGGLDVMAGLKDIGAPEFLSQGTS